MAVKKNYVEIAKNIATEAHKGQKDKGGMDYITHPAFVAAHVENDEEKAAAWLHDVIEDTEVTLEDLVAAAIPKDILKAVEAITKRDGEDYSDYIRRVASNRIASVVKKADMTHNMDISRIPDPKEEDYERVQNYKKKLVLLEELVAQNQKQPQEIKLADTDKYLSLARNALGERGLAAFWSGSGIEFNVSSGKLSIDIECGYDQHEIMADILIDGERSQKISLVNGCSRYIIYSGMNPEKPVCVRIMRDTQCMPDDEESYMIIKSIIIDGNGRLMDPPEYEYHIEFIGDSLTSGEGCGLIKREEWNSVVFDAMECYTYKTAELMDAAYQVISESGWGLYASYDANYDHAIPNYYDQVCGTSSCQTCIELGAHEKWNFKDSGMDPDAVVINLGTNDGSAMKLNEGEKEKFIRGFKARAVEFLKKIREKNGASYIIWAYGMLGYDMEPYILEAIEEYKSETKDSRMEYLKLPACSMEELGARFHPTPEAHSKVAKCLSEKLVSARTFLLR